MGGTAEVVKHDVQVVTQEGAAVGLQSNERKSEVICADYAVRSSVLSSIPGAKVIDPTSGSLLGSAISELGLVSDAILQKG